MEDMYKLVKDFFSHDMDLDDLFDSEAIIWIDWREDDEDVVNYFNDMMDEPIDIQTVSNGKQYGDDIVLQKGDKKLLIPYGDEKDRDVTIKYFNDFVKPDYEVRWFAESLGGDTLGFTVLSGAEWTKLNDEFGADTVRYYFEPIDRESNMFNLDMDEVFALLALRENSDGMNTDFSTQLDWIKIINKEKALTEQKENGQIDLKQYMVAKKELQQIKDEFIATHGEME
ncbi:hypothetical protein [Veillonella parvula]|uniref:Uncharacterized protein n=1 Tax=Veillonella parvula TaxID=29466 RepID=A0AB38YPF1_VEIPA|nr:hypothetical protein [Veillonella parvula]EFB85917.1 hypothetical protein HMPREF1035_0596 [Veillonella parvula ATCC 17745]WMS19604.1 hypothetical protein RDV51_09240 [Veillonella parvula]